MRRSFSPAAAALFASSTIAIGCGGDVFDARPPANIANSVTSTTSLTAIADTHLRSGSPNKNYGSNTTLIVEKNGNKRALVKFDTAAIQAAVAGRTIVSASLRLTILNSASGFPTGGANLAAHTLTQNWTEAGATWNCAIDTNTANGAADCPADAWSMGAPPNPWTTVGVTTLVISGQTGVVAFDVTADVAAFAAGTLTNQGWLVKKENEALNGSVIFRSREGTVAPQLELTLAGPCGDGTVDALNNEMCDDGNTMSGDGCSANCAIEYCGDGVVNNGGEECDDGNTTAGDGCNAACADEYCGDGVLNDLVESCDDGNATWGDGCSPACDNEPDYWTPNGPVLSLAMGDGVLYLGGTFDYVGPRTGGFATIDSASGQAAITGDEVDGVVDAIVSDGTGGWFIGGTLSAVGGVPRANLAHILADGSPSSWNPGADNGVSAIAFGGDTVFVGGQFTSVGGQPRSRLAAIEASTGAITDWDPSPNGWVATIMLVGTTVYAGGGFSVVGGQARNRVAAIDSVAGAVSGWNPNINSGVMAIAADANLIYVGGLFSSVGGQPRNRLAAVDAVTGLATTWNPGITSGSVNTLVVDGGVLYVGGSFFGAQRYGLAAYELSTGALTPWNPNADLYSTVDCLAVMDDVIYAGGSFSSIGGQPRRHLAAINAATGTPTTWTPMAGSHTHAIAAVDGRIAAGGIFSSVGGVERRGLAAFDLATGAATAWDADLGGAWPTVRSLVHDDGVLYAGGSFEMNPQTRLNLVALDTSSGVPTGWNPSANGQVFAMARSGALLYVGGDFTSIASEPRERLAALDFASGAVTSFNPGADGAVRALAHDGNALYVGGVFTTVGGQARNRIAAIDVATGSTTAWDPGMFDAEVNAITVSDNTGADLLLSTAR